MKHLRTLNELESRIKKLDKKELKEKQKELEEIEYIMQQLEKVEYPTEIFYILEKPPLFPIRNKISKKNIKDISIGV